MYSIMLKLIFVLFTLLHIKLAIAVLVPSIQSRSSDGYIYNVPSYNPYNDYPYALPLKSQYIPSFPSHLSSPHNDHSVNFNLPPSFLNNYLNPEDDIYYTHDGRPLKQYEVMERIIGDLEHPDTFLGSSPLLLDSLLSKLSSQVNQGYYDYLANRLSPIQPVTKNHGPVALGSGGLGYIRLSNGAAYLGSGSLGYISGQDANQALVDAKTRKGLTPPGPLHFGHGFQ